MNEEENHEEQEKSAKAKTGSASSGDAVYGLGMIGAWVYFWKKADTPKGRATGLLKGMVWPAILVYEAFSAVSGRPAPKEISTSE